MSELAVTPPTTPPSSELQNEDLRHSYFAALNEAQRLAVRAQRQAFDTVRSTVWSWYARPDQPIFSDS